MCKKMFILKVNYSHPLILAHKPRRLNAPRQISPFRVFLEMLPSIIIGAITFSFRFTYRDLARTAVCGGISACPGNA